MALLELSALSTQYVSVAVSAQVAGVAINPTGDTVQMAFTAQNVAPQSGDWKTASWDTYSTTPVSYAAKCLVGPSGVVSMTAGSTYDVYVKVADNPETPVLKAGSIRAF